ncbi:Rv1733c family protein [Streptomyces sp. NPDC000878]
MARTHRAKVTRVRLWRWRHNALRRHSDVVEARIVFATWTLALLGAAFAGQTAAEGADQGLTERRAAVHTVTVVLAEDASRIPPTTTGFDDGKVWAQVRWTTVDGVTHTARTKVEPEATAGTRVTAWADSTGALVAEPPTATEAKLEVVGTGLLVASGTGSAVLAGGWLVRKGLLRRRLVEWDAEWKRVGPQWRNLSGGKG